MTDKPDILQRLDELFSKLDNNSVHDGASLSDVFDVAISPGTGKMFSSNSWFIPLAFKSIENIGQYAQDGQISSEEFIKVLAQQGHNALQEDPYALLQEEPGDHCEAFNDARVLAEKYGLGDNEQIVNGLAALQILGSNKLERLLETAEPRAAELTTPDVKIDIPAFPKNR